MFHDLTDKAQDRLSEARKQMGTLEGGNHFIELCLDTTDNVWPMLYSGARNIGKTLAEIHIGRAKKLRCNAERPDKDHAVLDGIPGVYKDIDQVIDHQCDLVEVVAQQEQVMCVKG